ncbi:MAG: PLD nuclease N-terminal domain-containing protein [Jatrophihabitantaceae bacterium]
MLLFDGVLGLFFLALWIFCIIDVITTPEDKVRNLPKIAWLLIVILLVDIGSIAWLVAGRVWNGEPRRPLAGTPARPAKRSLARNPDDDDEFLASLRSRAEEQRRRAREAQGKEEPDPTDEG